MQRRRRPVDGKMQLEHELGPLMSGFWRPIFFSWRNLVEKVTASQERDCEMGGYGDGAKPDRVIGRWGDGENLEMRNSEFGMRNLNR